MHDWTTPKPLISVITPTYNRAVHLKNLIRNFQAQTYSQRELLIYDDSEQPCEWLKQLADHHPSIHYFFSSTRLTIGEKRNFLIQQASGDVIAHFDDDDYYAPNYLETLHAHLQTGGYDFISLKSWFAYSILQDKFAYWETDRLAPSQYCIYKNHFTKHTLDEFPSDFIEKNLYGYGFSFMFQKHIIKEIHFPAVNHGEDYHFCKFLIDQGYKAGFLTDSQGIVLHVMHEDNTSSIFPQHLFPTTLMHRIFSGYANKSSTSC